MSASFTKREGYTVEFEMTVKAEKFEEGMQKSYIKNVKGINIPGFRKGKAPRKYIEKIYTEAIFYDDAINFVFPEEYQKAIDDLKIEPVDRPDVDIKEIGNGKDLVLTVKVDVTPEVEVGEYKGLEVEEKKYTASAEDVKAELERMRERNSRMITVEDRAVKKGDTAVIDFEGFVDGVAFDGGKAENHELVIGSNSFIPGFEDQIIGASTGDEIDVNVTFPEEYHAEELKGKAALFKVKVNQIKFKELPALDDEFAKDVSEFDTLADLKKDIKAKINDANSKRAKTEMENQAIEKLVETLKADIPSGMIEARVDSLLREMEMRLYQQGMNMEMYMKYTGMNEETFRMQFKPQAEHSVKCTLALEKVAELENIKVSEKELDAKIEEMAKAYGMDLEKAKESLSDSDKENIKKDCKIEKAITVLVKNANIVKPAAEDKKEEKKAPAKKATTKATEEKAAEKKPAAKKATTKKPAEKKETEKKPAAKKAPAKKTASKDKE